MTRHSRAWQLSMAVLACTLVLGACERQVAPKVEPPRPVRTVVARLDPVGTKLVLPAEIRPRIETRYGFRVAGKIAERYVSVGDRVSPGQRLARLDPQDAAPAVEAARGALAAATTDERLAGTELRRLRELRERNFISQAQLDRQQAVLDSAVARVRSAQAQLRQATNAVEFQQLKADAPGYVVAVEAEAGQVVAAAQPVIRVAKSGELEAVVNVPETGIGHVRAAARWRVLVPALGNRALEGRLRELSPVSDAASRTYAMRLTLSGPLQGVEMGMTASVEMERSEGSAIVLPITALHSRDGKPQVWIVDATTDTVRSVAVRTSGLGESTVRVAQGVAVGDRIVTAGANLLVQGQKVRPVEVPVLPVAARD